MTLEKDLSKIYYDTKNGASFGSVKKLYNEIKLKHPGITENKVKEWLEGELTYTLHFPAKKKFKRNRIIVNHINEQWEADLVDMKEFSIKNNQFKYILTVIDCFSKYAYAIALKTKDGISLTNAFKKLFKHNKCQNLRTDRGREFLNSSLKRLLNKNNINHFTSFNDDIKCAIVERFNRTLKSKMFKYFTAHGTRKYINELQNFIIAYNSSYHRSIKMKPIEVNQYNEKIVFKNLYGADDERELISNNKTQKPKLKPGDKVRTKYTLSSMDKGYYPNWSDQTYTIEKSIKNNIPVYKIQDFAGEKLNQKFYSNEIQKVKDNLHRIEKIIKTRKNKSKIEHFVKWLNYPDSFNSWVLAKDIVKL